MTVNQVLDALTPEIRQDHKVWPKHLRGLTAVLATNKINQGIDPQTAIEKAQNIIITIAHYFGGRSIYLPANEKLKMVLRDLVSLLGNKHKTNWIETFKAEFPKDKQTWPALLAELFDIIFRFYESREGLQPGDALEETQGVIGSISKYHGGRALYFPQNDKLKIAIRDQAVIKAFNGQNHLELSLKTKLTTAQIYSIIKKKSHTDYHKNTL